MVLQMLTLRSVFLIIKVFTQEQPGPLLIVKGHIAIVQLAADLARPYAGVPIPRTGRTAVDRKEAAQAPLSGYVMKLTRAGKKKNYCPSNGAIEHNVRVFAMCPAIEFQPPQLKVKYTIEKLHLSRSLSAGIS